MKDNKFRAWDKTKKRWFGGGYETQLSIHPSGYPQWWSYKNGFENVSKLVEIVFSTGIKDVNRKEIFEGDILISGDIKIKYTVVWLDCGLRAKQISNSSTIGLIYWREKLEIIGNVFENPELLKNEHHV